MILRRFAVCEPAGQAGFEQHAQAPSNQASKQTRRAQKRAFSPCRMRLQKQVKHSRQNLCASTRTIEGTRKRKPPSHYSCCCCACTRALLDSCGCYSSFSCCCLSILSRYTIWLSLTGSERKNDALLLRKGKRQLRCWRVHRYYPLLLLRTQL